MPNPLHYTNSQFWQSVTDIDKLIKESGAPLPLLYEPLKRIATIDTDMVARVARDAWGMDPTGRQDNGDSLTARLHRLADTGATTMNRVGSAWSGPAATSFKDSLESLLGSIETIQTPAAQVGKSLKQLSEKIDQSLLEIVSNVGKVSGLVAALTTLTVSLLAAPEPVFTKVLGVVGAILATIASVVTIITTTIKEEYGKFQSIESSLRAVLTMDRSLPN